MFPDVHCEESPTFWRDNGPQVSLHYMTQMDHQSHIESFPMNESHQQEDSVDSQFVQI